MSSVGQARAALSPGEVSVAGAGAGALTRLVCQPLDVAKIRLQLQAELGAARKYSNIGDLLVKMTREEGLASLWKGHVPAQLLSVSYGFASFAVFESLASSLKFEGDTNAQYRPLVHFVCGSAGGCAGTLASFPWDVVRTRLVAQQTSVYSGTRHAVAELHASGGLRAFYRGFVPACLSVAPQSGLQFGLYSVLTQALGGWALTSDRGVTSISTQGSLVCGAMAGMATKTLLYPLDVVKKRMQVSGWTAGREGLGATPAYSNMRSCFLSIVRVEGARSLYRGFTPGLIKAMTTTSIHFTAYEWVCKLFILSRNTSSY